MNSFRGIPSPFDYLDYETAHYDAVRQKTLDVYGASATLVDATKAMNTLGNVSFFEFFPDILNSTKEKLGYLYQPSFETLDNEFTDYEHALSHIRAKCSHTSMGESMLKPDQFYMMGMSYMRIKNLRLNTSYQECAYTPMQLSQYKGTIIPYPKMVLMDLRRIGIRDKIPFTAYRNTYHEGKFQIDYPAEKKLSATFHTQPVNDFEKRLSLQLIRAIYMDEKYKTYSSTMTSYIHTPISASTKESYELVFTNQEENQWIQKVAALLQDPTQKEKLTSIVNTTHDKSSDAQKIASKAIQTFTKHYLGS